jgi:hypothetical protein
MMLQLDIFQEMTETEILREEVRLLRDSNEKVRKSLYARHGELAKKYVDIHNRLQILEHNICRNLILRS